MGNEDFIVVVILTQRRKQSDNRKHVNFDQLPHTAGKMESQFYVTTLSPSLGQKGPDWWLVKLRALWNIQGDGIRNLGQSFELFAVYAVKDNYQRRIRLSRSYEKNKGFCWITEKHDRCTEHPADQDSLTNIIEGEKSEWNSGWYCFLTRKEKPKMQAKKCNENNDERFICEKGNKLNLLLRSEVKDCSDETLKITHRHLVR